MSQRRINDNVYDRAIGIRVATCPHCGEPGEWYLAPSQTGILLCWNCDQIYHKSGQPYPDGSPNYDKRDEAIPLHPRNTLPVRNVSELEKATDILRAINKRLRKSKK